MLAYRDDGGAVEYEHRDIVRAVVLHAVDEQLELRPYHLLAQMHDLGLAVFALQLLYRLFADIHRCADCNISRFPIQQAMKDFLGDFARVCAR